MELLSPLPKPLLSSTRREMYQVHSEHKNKLTSCNKLISKKKTGDDFILKPPQHLFEF